MFAVILIVGTYFCGSLEKSQKISCHTVLSLPPYLIQSRAKHMV